MTARTESPHLLIRADAGGDLGTGHVMRMLALAQAWQDRGGLVTLAACQCPAPLIERLISENIPFIAIDSPLGADHDQCRTIEIASNILASWIVLDGYHFSSAYQKKLKDAGFQVLAVDDYGHCDIWHADIVLNQNISQAEKKQQDDGAQHLRTPRYALLRREFKFPVQHRPLSHQSPLRLLVTFGGVDPQGATLHILKSLVLIKSCTFHASVLLGQANPHIQEILAYTDPYPEQFQVMLGCHNMRELYDSVDLIISAGGSSCYEWMSRKRKGWVTSIAANQDDVVRAMLRLELAAGLPSLDGLSYEDIANSIELWVADHRPPCESGIDGYGADRVATYLAKTPCWIRTVDPVDDARFLFELANLPCIRSVGYHIDPIAWDDHVAWLKSHASSDQSELYMIEHEQAGHAGLVRFHHRGEGAWEIGIAIHPDHRKEGIAFTALSLAMLSVSKKHPVIHWLASIKSSNKASQKLFQKLGFRCKDIEQDMEHWILTTTAKSTIP